MQSENLISAIDCCMHYDIDLSFINYLHEYGLIEIATEEQQSFIPAEQLYKLEKYIRMHYELNINMEGIEAIDHLLGKVEKLQEEISAMKSKIDLFSSSVVTFSNITS